MVEEQALAQAQGVQQVALDLGERDGPQAVDPLGQAVEVEAVRNPYRNHEGKSKKIFEGVPYFLGPTFNRKSGYY